MDLTLANEMICEAMRKHGMFAKGWVFEWDNAKRRFGMCSYQPKKTIYMSKPITLLNSEESVRDTILHEIAHALVGPGQHHNHIWRAKARNIGAVPIACYDSDVTLPTPKFIGTCESCGVEISRYKFTKWLKSDNKVFHSRCRRAGKSANISWRKI